MIDEARAVRDGVHCRTGSTAHMQKLNNPKEAVTDAWAGGSKLPSAGGLPMVRYCTIVTFLTASVISHDLSHRPFHFVG